MKYQRKIATIRVLIRESCVFFEGRVVKCILGDLVINSTLNSMLTERTKVNFELSIEISKDVCPSFHERGKKTKF